MSVFPTAPALLRSPAVPAEGEHGMDLTQALAQSRPTVGATCSTGKLLAEADPKTRADLQAALNDPNVSNAHLARALSLLGHKVTDGTIRRHRVGECRCGS